MSNLLQLNSQTAEQRDSARGFPSSWLQSELGKVAKWGSGGTPKSGTPEFYGGELPWAVIGDLTETWVSETAQSITKAGLEKSSARIIEPGTVMLAMYGASIGRTGIAAVKMATNQAIAFAVPVEGVIDKQFLLKYLQSQKQIFVRAGQGGAQPNISQTVIKSWPVPVPPIAEQIKIVEVLDEQLSRLDAALASVHAVRGKAVRFRRSLLHSAFSGALTGHDSSSGTLPDEWRLLKVGDFATVKGGKRLPKGTQWSEVRTNHPYIRATDIKNGKINEENLVYVPEKTWPTISRYVVATNDVIITIAGTIGSVAVVPETLNEANLTENAAKICHLQDVLARFLQLYLISPFSHRVN
jgi:type I restriction enzyme S subunit